MRDDEAPDGAPRVIAWGTPKFDFLGPFERDEARPDGGANEARCWLAPGFDETECWRRFAELFIADSGAGMPVRLSFGFDV